MLLYYFDARIFSVYIDAYSLFNRACRPLISIESSQKYCKLVSRTHCSRLHVYFPNRWQSRGKRIIFVTTI